MSRHLLSEGEREPGPELPAEQARQAKPLGRMRYVLGFSTALVILAFAAIYFSF